MNPTTTDILLDLLKRAAAAHDIHEKEDLGGVYDEQWPEWYAAHMAQALAAEGYAITPLTNDNDNTTGENNDTH